MTIAIDPATLDFLKWFIGGLFILIIFVGWPFGGRKK